jgi:hypothetical protein
MRCGYELRDVGQSLSWAALHSFIENIGAESCVARDIDPELHAWATTMKTNKILADIYDLLSIINSNLVAVGSRKHPKKPKFYPRPKKDGNKYGKKPVPVKELRSMFSGKRKRRHGK